MMRNVSGIPMVGTIGNKAFKATDTKGRLGALFSFAPGTGANEKTQPRAVGF
jgi:hypothetical protein